MRFVDLLATMKSFRHRNSVSYAEIKDAENKLGLYFSEEYKDYLSQYGEVSIYGHEFTGICDSKRLNVVEVTIEQKENNPSIPDEYYVVEELNIDDCVIWQDKNGAVYSSMPNEDIKLEANSLKEYIENCEI